MPPKKLGTGEEDKPVPHLANQLVLVELWKTISET